MIDFKGPPLKEGPLPALFYFALSKEESLHQDPYNQPVRFLEGKPMRIFSLSLPEHGPGLNPVDALSRWADRFAQGEDLLAPFLDSALALIDELIEKKIVLKDQIGCMGLSRGGLIAGHITARIPFVKAWVAFAPLTELSRAREFYNLPNPIALEQYNLLSLTDLLYDRPCKFYIGNRDTRVHTRSCFDLVEALANTAYEKGLRSPPIELQLSPSIGQHGHGTSPGIFQEGADWIAKQLGVE